MAKSNSSCSSATKLGGSASNSGTRFMSASEYDAASKGGKSLGGGK